MDFTLRLFFTGLLAFVPVDETGEEVNAATTTPKAVWVLGLDANPPDPVYDRFMKPIDPHFVGLRFHEVYDRGSRPTVNCITNVDTPCRSRANDPCVDANGNVEKCRVALISDGRSMDLDFGAGSVPLTLSVDGTQFNRLISLRQIYTATVIDPLWTGSVRPPLAFRLKLEYGTLEPWKDITNVAGNPIKVTFDPKEQWNDRYGVSRLALTISGLRESVTFDSDIEDITLGPDPTCQRNCIVEVELLHSPYYEAINPCATHKSESTRHFELHWNLATLLSRPSPRPAPKPAPALPPTADLLCPEVRP